MSTAYPGPRPSGGERRGHAADAAWVAIAVHRAAHSALYLGTRLLNPFMLQRAGSTYLPLLAVIHHRGRRSGRSYLTPVGARPMADGFVVALTFGDQSDWFQNVRAAGGCVIRWNGTYDTVEEPEIVDWAAARPAVKPMERVLMPLIGIDQCVRLRHVGSARTDPQ